MIELKDDNLVFSFPEVHKDAQLSVSFQRTLRIPDDGQSYPLPPGIGEFPLHHVDDYASGVPRSWSERGGVMMPMYQSEAMWICFSGGYPFAVKVATGKINAVTGEEWIDGIHRDPQDYMVSREQPWLDGYCVEENLIRQFVAMPLGSGYSAEEQLTAKAEYGGLQIMAYPMKAEAYEREIVGRHDMMADFGIKYSSCESSCLEEAVLDMGLAPGGLMRQQIYVDEYDFEVWDLRHSSRCFVHIGNSQLWQQLTGSPPPTMPATAKQYSQSGLPWFDYYDDGALAGSDKLKGMKSVAQLGKEKGESPLPENESAAPKKVVNLSPKKKRAWVREW